MAITVKWWSIVLAWIENSSSYSRCRKMASTNKLPVAWSRWKIPGNLTNARKVTRDWIGVLRCIISKAGMSWINTGINKTNYYSFSSSFISTFLDPRPLWQTQELWCMCGCSSNRKIRNHICYFSPSWKLLRLRNWWIGQVYELCKYISTQIWKKVAVTKK